MAATFLRNLIAVVPYRIHTILTKKGVRFTKSSKDRRNVAAHVFGKICGKNGIEHRHTKECLPGTKRTNRTLKEAMVKHCFYDTHEQFREHLGTFLNAYNFAGRLKTLWGRTPFEEVMNWLRKVRERFILEFGYRTQGMNTYHDHI